MKQNSTKNMKLSHLKTIKAKIEQKSINNMKLPFEGPFKDKYAGRSPERILCLYSVRLVLIDIRANLSDEINGIKSNEIRGMCIYILNVDWQKIQLIRSIPTTSTTLFPFFIIFFKSFSPFFSLHQNEMSAYLRKARWIAFSAPKA